MLFVVAGVLIVTMFALGLLLYRLHALVRLLLQFVIVIVSGFVFWRIIADKGTALFYMACVNTGSVLADFPRYLSKREV